MRQQPQQACLAGLAVAVDEEEWLGGEKAAYSHARLSNFNTVLRWPFKRRSFHLRPFRCDDLELVRFVRSLADDYLHVQKKSVTLSLLGTCASNLKTRRLWLKLSNSILLNHLTSAADLKLRCS